MYQAGLKKILFPFAMAIVVGLGLTASAYANEEVAKSLNRDWNDAFNMAEIDKVAAMYAEDAIVSPANGKLIKGREAIRELFQSFVDNGFSRHEIDVIEAQTSGNIMYQVAEWRATGAPQNAVIPFYEGILTIVFVRDDADDDWRIKSHTWNMEE
ncbi:MAG: SgcJ/EcaC family oxidoreductase [Gammaproteobacteria bacterium]